MLYAETLSSNGIKMLFVRTVIVNIRTDTVVFTRLKNNTRDIELANCACVRIIAFTSVATEIVRVRACAVVETWRLAARYENFTVHSSVQSVSHNLAGVKNCFLKLSEELEWRNNDI